IVRNHGGDVTVDSQVGKGTVFEVFFPIAKGRPELAVVAEGGFPGGDERVLFVDDEPYIVEIYQPILERLGYEVSAYTSSIEALEAFGAKPNQFDLVITDQTMPRMTGQMMAEEMMAIRSDIPIILCTGHSDLVDEAGAVKMGIRAFVMKPVVMGVFSETIRKVLENSALLECSG
ncbi:MAG: response regulator, partial [Desulfobacterales bacterium]